MSVDLWTSSVLAIMRLLCSSVLLLLGLMQTTLAATRWRDTSEVEESLDRLSDELHRGSVCLNDDNCNFYEFCDTSDISDPHCKLPVWLVAAGSSVLLLLLLVLAVVCICCPFCCLYSICKSR